jgi:putative lipoprotein
MASVLVLSLLLFQPREAALEGEWMVEVVDNIKVLPESVVTMTFSGARIMGQASCNSYTGTYHATANGIKLEGLLTTMRACDPSRMSQERDFLSVLRAVDSFEISSSGVLVLRTSAGKAISARRRAK